MIVLALLVLATLAAAFLPVWVACVLLASALMVAAC